MSTSTIEEKRKHEQETIQRMIEIYCHGKHHTKEGLCPDCQELADYAHARTARCPHMATKTFCSACKTHCYAPAMRPKIQDVMRYSGMRMLLYAPGLALYHIYIQLKCKFTA